MSDPADPKPIERTGRQDLTQAVTAGLFANLWGGYSSGVITSGGTFGVGGQASQNGAFPDGFAQFLALRGSGTSEGTNKYSPPLFMPGGGIYSGLLPGFNQPWPGTYTTYRVMMAHPTIALGMDAVCGPIIAGEWNVIEEKNAPSGAKEMVEERYLNRRSQIVFEKLKALAFGWRGFELVKGYGTIANGRYYTTQRNKVLLPELTEILTDDRGNFAGLRNGDATLTAENSSVYSFDKDGDYWYGRCLLENCRRAWSNWLCVDDNLYRLGTKAASIIPYIGYPPGEGKDAQGNVKSHYEVACSMAQGMARGQAVVYPNLANLSAANVEDLLRGGAKLAEMSLWNHGTIDMGNSGPAQMAMIEQLQYYDKLLVRGMKQPERSLLEARHGGSRADSKDHGDNATNNCDAIAADIVAQTNEQEVDGDLVANFGESARGSVRLVAVPLIDEKKITDDKLLDGIAANPQTLTTLIEKMDMSKWMDRVGLDKRDDLSDEEAQHWDDLMLPPNPANTNTGPSLEDSRKNGRNDDEPIRLSSVEDEAEGHWVTIGGEHVFIGKGGTIEKGPAAMVGKKPSEVGHEGAQEKSHETSKTEQLRQKLERVHGARLEAEKHAEAVKDEVKEMKGRLESVERLNNGKRGEVATLRAKIDQAEATLRDLRASRR